MTTFAATLESVGDWRALSVVGWTAGGGVVAFGLRGNDIISHYEGAPIDDLTVLPFGGNKDTISAVVIDDNAYLFWSTGADVQMAVWNVRTRAAVAAPASQFPGRVPSVQILKGTILLVHFIDLANKHANIVSRNLGGLWAEERQLHGNDVAEVDVSVSPLDDQTGVWDETNG